MLLIHQTGSVKIGEVVRYTVTYTPSQDRILPSPERLHVRIRNTSAIALRAAFVHGPYTLSVAAYPSGFDPNEKFQNPRRYGVPEFEPMVKAGGSWQCELVVPDNVRQGAGMGSHGGFGKGPEHDAECASWIIEVSSQVIFSTSAAVGYELLVARDKKSLHHLGSSSVPGVQGQHSHQPGKLADYQQSKGAKDGTHPSQPKGIHSRAVRLKVEDTATLWNTPRLPDWDDEGDSRVKHRHASEKPVESMVDSGDPETKDPDSQKSEVVEREKSNSRKQKKVHLVLLTHGLHSNLGADMLFIKESIDAAVQQSKKDGKARRAKERAARGRSAPSRPGSGSSGSQPQGEDESDPPPEDEDASDEDDDEEVIVRGYSGNATKTERGIKYLGKRLARYALSMTYPDQPYLPLGKDMAEHGSNAAHAAQGAAQAHASQQADKQEGDSKAAHKHNTLHTGWHRDHQSTERRPYKITSISFIAHSLGGLVQTYAVAYIQKHSPEFFNLIKPINFVALATPFLGLSNENPMYVKFALDFGLVGRTGKDLGLTWRAPTLARSGWGAIVGNLGESAHKKVYGESQAESKPLLRILPTGPAHTALKKFKNRTVYSNVVNDGIVPLRTSCLLFLDWHGLGRVEKARRDAGLVETMVGFGWAELTGTNMANARQRQLTGAEEQYSDSGATTPKGNMSQVPQPASDAVAEDDRASINSIGTPYAEGDAPQTQQGQEGQPGMGVGGPFSGFFNFFKSNDPPKQQPVTQKQKKIYDMSQTLQAEAESSSSTLMTSDAEQSRPKVTTGQELEEEMGSLNAPPRTTFFESAGDLLNPQMPDVDYLIDPSRRPRTIFHDRVYHPTDIPAPPMRRRTSPLLSRKTFSRSNTGNMSATSSVHDGVSKSEEASIGTKDQDRNTEIENEDKLPEEIVDDSNMRVEEKIARAYHRDLSWRKVLVKLEPDAHNNIFVRRMFVNAYGWPVVKHIVDAHFGDSSGIATDEGYLGERALPMNQPPNEHGGEIKTDMNYLRPVDSGLSDARTESESREALDQVPDLPSSQGHDGERYERGDSVTWSDRDWVDSEYESDIDFSSDGKADASSDKKGDSSPGRDWSWTEKIVGKGKARSPTSAKSPPPTAPPPQEQQQQQQSPSSAKDIENPLQKQEQK